MTTSTKSKIQQDIIDAINEGVLDIKDISVLTSQAKRTYVNKLKSDPNYQSKEYMDFEFVSTAYSYILENSCTASEALDYAAEYLSYPDNYVGKTKHNKFYHTKEVVDQHDNHPKQKQMLKDRTLDKKLVKKSTTANQLTSSLSKAVELHDILDDLRNTVESQQETISSLSVTNDKHEKEIGDLQEITGVKVLTKKEQAQYLASKGHNINSIASSLGVDRKTISRYLK